MYKKKIINVQNHNKQRYRQATKKSSFNKENGQICKSIFIISGNIIWILSFCFDEKKIDVRKSKIQYVT